MHKPKNSRSSRSSAVSTASSTSSVLTAVEARRGKLVDGKVPRSLAAKKVVAVKKKTQSVAAAPKKPNNPVKKPASAGAKKVANPVKKPETKGKAPKEHAKDQKHAAHGSGKDPKRKFAVQAPKAGAKPAAEKHPEKHADKVHAKPAAKKPEPAVATAAKKPVKHEAAKHVEKPAKMHEPKHDSDIEHAAHASEVEKEEPKKKAAKEPGDDLKAAPKAETKVEPKAKDVNVTVAAGDDDEVVLTDAEGRRYCRVKDCDQAATVDSYCRYHYLLFWKNIQNRKKILSEGKLERYIEELTARYPDKYLELLRKDLRSEKDFMAAIQELEIDESAVDNEFEDEAQSYLDEVRGMSGSDSGGSERDEEF